MTSKETIPNRKNLDTEKDAPRQRNKEGKNTVITPTGEQARHISAPNEHQTRSEAEELSLAIASAIDPKKQKPKPLSKEQEDGLFAYYSGKRALPTQPEHRARILHRIALYQRDFLQPRHLREYGAIIEQYFKSAEGKHLKEKLAEFDREKRKLQEKYKPEGRVRFDATLWPQAYFEEVEALDRRLFSGEDGTRNQLVPLGLPYRPDRTQADDMPEISPVLALILHENPEVLVEARRSFMLALSTGIGDEKSPEGKFCRVLSMLLSQGHRMYAEAGDIARLHQLENVSLVLLTYGILRPTTKALPNGRRVPSFSINAQALRQDVADFLTLERSSRTKDESGAEMQDAAVQEAVARIEARAQRIGTKEPRTAVAAICGRLNLPIRSLPVFDEPQEEDAKKVNARSGVGKRSLDAALQTLSMREQTEEHKYDPSGITERLTTSSNILARIEESLVTYAEHIETLDGLTSADTDTQRIARGLLRQITTDSDSVRSELKNMQRLINYGKDKPDANREYREKRGGEIIARAEFLASELRKLDIRLGKLIYTDFAPDDALASATEQRTQIQPQDSLSPSETDAFRTKAELLQRELDFVKEEAKDHVAALTAFQEKIESLLKHMSARGSRTDFAREQVVIKMRLKAALEALETYLEIITPDTQN